MFREGVTTKVPKWKYPESVNRRRLKGQLYRIKSRSKSRVKAERKRVELSANTLSRFVRKLGEGGKKGTMSKYIEFYNQFVFSRQSNHSFCLVLLLFVVLR